MVEAGAVGGEVAHLPLDHGVAAVVDFNQRVVGKLGAHIAALFGMAGEGGEHVERGGGFGGLLQLRQGRLKLFEQGVVELFFKRERALLRAEHFVFKGF